jgi:hypothetical protein
MEKTFQYHQQIFAGLELEIYNDLLKKDKIFLQCIKCAITCMCSTQTDRAAFLQNRDA